MGCIVAVMLHDCYHPEVHKPTTTMLSVYSVRILPNNSWMSWSHGVVATQITDFKYLCRKSCLTYGINYFLNRWEHYSESFSKGPVTSPASSNPVPL